MKYVIRYLLEGNGSIPHFVKDGGYFISGEELVGISVDSSSRHLPSTVVKLTRAQLKARILLVSRSLDGALLTEAEAESCMNQFLAQHGMENYE